MLSSRSAIHVAVSLLMTSLGDVIAAQEKIDDGGIDPETSFDTSSG